MDSIELEMRKALGLPVTPVKVKQQHESKKGFKVTLYCRKVKNSVVTDTFETRVFQYATLSALEAECRAKMTIRKEGFMVWSTTSVEPCLI